MKVTKKQYRRLVDRVEDLTDAHNHLAEHQDSLQIMVQQRLGQVVEMLEALRPAYIEPQDGNDFVPCPVCHQMLKPVGAEEAPVVPAHDGAARRLMGNALVADECSGSYFPVSNIRPGDEPEPIRCPRCNSVNHSDCGASETVTDDHLS